MTRSRALPQALAWAVPLALLPPVAELTACAFHWRHGKVLYGFGIVAVTGSSPRSIFAPAPVSLR